MTHVLQISLGLEQFFSFGADQGPEAYIPDSPTLKR